MNVKNQIKTCAAMAAQVLFSARLGGLFLIVFIVLLSSVSGNSRQNPVNRSTAGDTNSLQQYTPSFDKDWSMDSYIRDVSPDGNWIAFTEYFNTTTDTLHLRHTSKNKALTLADTYNAIFASNSKWFASLTEEKQLSLINLQNVSVTKTGNITSFAFSFDGAFLAYLQEMENKKSLLWIKNLLGEKEYAVKDVTKFAWNPQTNDLLIVVEENQAVKIVNMEAVTAKKQRVKGNMQSTVNHLKWNDTGTAAIFIEQRGDTNVLSIYGKEKKRMVLNDSIISMHFQGYMLSEKEPLISEDGKRILFYRHKKPEAKSKENHTVEIWNTQDPLLYPKLKLYKNYIVPFLVTAWFPESDIIKEIGTEETPFVAMNANHDKAIVFDKLKYGLQHTEFPKVDLYLKHLKTGEKDAIVQRQSIDPELISISSSGKYIAYFNEKDWWVYHTEKNKSINLTRGLNVGFLNKKNQHPDQREEVFQKPYWLKNDTHIIISDEFDLWKVTPDGKHKKRITRGREKNTIYKINRDLKVSDDLKATTYMAFYSQSVDLAKGVILNMYNFDSQKTGIAIWNEKDNVKTITFEESNVHSVVHAQNSNKIVCKKHTFTKPTAIYSYDLKTSAKHKVFQTNKDLLKYDLGKKELFNIIGEDGVRRNNALIYPANYNPNKKYPMIVYIYDKTSQNAMLFTPPTGHSSQGFNPLNYTTDGYFVLYPDISYTLSKPGISARNSVNNAVNKALENKSIDKDRIGLIGHSFGGYEAAFIATQTDRFAAIVAGAAVTNMTSHYHGVNWNHKNPDAWRYEDQQWRMGVSYYENKEAYLQNSPLEFVDNVSTPLLLWTGDKDYQITWTQSLEMFMALTRLNKTAKLLLLKDEPHAPGKSENQLKLSQEIKKWFDLYCK